MLSGWISPCHRYTKWQIPLNPILGGVFLYLPLFWAKLPHLLKIHKNDPFNLKLDRYLELTLNVFRFNEKSLSDVKFLLTSAPFLCWVSVFLRKWYCSRKKPCRFSPRQLDVSLGSNCIKSFIFISFIIFKRVELIWVDLGIFLPISFWWGKFAPPYPEFSDPTWPPTWWSDQIFFVPEMPR